MAEYEISVFGTAQVCMYAALYLTDFSVISNDKCLRLTILIFEKLIRPSSVMFDVPSSINDRSVRYIPRYGMQGGSHLAETQTVAGKYLKHRYRSKEKQYRLII